MPSEIIFNSKIYASVDEMPPEVRQAYEKVMGVLADKDQNGVPDILEGKMAGVLADTFEQAGSITQSTTFVVDGKTYHSLDELPAEARQKYEAAMSKMDANRDGAQDWLEALATRSQTASHPAQSPNIPISSTVSEPTIIGADSSDPRLALAGCAIIVLLIVIGVMAYMLWIR